jgi:hypothetical protein
MMKALLPAVSRAMFPFYSPRKAKAPLQYRQVMKEFDAYAVWRK